MKHVVFLVSCIIFTMQALVMPYNARQSLEQMIAETRLPVVVKFYLPSCGPCQRIKPIIDNLSQEFAGRIAFIEVDIKHYTHLARDYGVMSVPTLLYVKNGQVVGRHKGFADAPTIRQDLQLYLL